MKRLLLLFFFLPTLLHAQDKLEEQWFSLLLEGKPIGFVHQTTWQIPAGLLRSEIEQSMEIRRFGIPFSMTQNDVWIEASGGALISVSSELDMNGQRQRFEARVLEQSLRVRLHRAEGVVETFLPFDRQPRGLYSVGREIAAVIAGSVENRELSYQLFSPETMKIEEFQLRVLGPGERIDSLGRAHRGILIEERSSGLPGIITTEVYDGEARLLYSRTPVGLELEILRLEGDPRGAPAAQPEEFAAVFDVASLNVEVDGLEDLRLGSTEAVDLLFRGRGVPVLYESVRSAEEDLAFPIDAPGEPGGTALQIVSAKRDARGEVSQLVLRVANRQDEFALASSASQPVPPALERYLKGGFHLDLDDPRLEELLDRCRIAEDGGFAAAGAESSGTAADTRTVLCLERLVDRYIQKKSLAYGFADLEEVLSKREGDCTEHALLMVALLRKKGTASRLAYGLILTEAGFIGHAWVELYDGRRWCWLDPSFPGGRPYGLKIRLGVMDPAEPVWASLSLTLLQVVGAVEAEILEAQLR
jgi:hypothetical protein